MADTSGVDSTPSWYQSNYSQSIVNETKSTSVVKVGAIISGDSCNLTTIVSGSDSSGDLPIQIVTNSTNTGYFAYRVATSGTTWGAWQQMAPEVTQGDVSSQVSQGNTSATSPQIPQGGTIIQGPQGPAGQSVWSYPYDRGANRLGSWWSDLKPTPTKANPPKVGDTIIDLVGNIYQITNVVVGTTGQGGGTFDYGPMLTNIGGPQGIQGEKGDPGFYHYTVDLTDAKYDRNKWYYVESGSVQLGSLGGTSYFSLEAPLFIGVDVPYGTHSEGNIKGASARQTVLYCPSQWGTYTARKLIVFDDEPSSWTTDNKRLLTFAVPSNNNLNHAFYARGGLKVNVTSDVPGLTWTPHTDTYVVNGTTISVLNNAPDPKALGLDDDSTFWALPMSQLNQQFKGDIEGIYTAVGLEMESLQTQIADTTVGTNLYTDTKNFYDLSSWVVAGGDPSSFWTKTTDTYNGCAVIQTTQDWNGLSQYIPVKNGDTLTYSAYVRNTSGTGTSSIYWELNYNPEGGYNSATTNITSNTVTVTDSWQRVSGTAVATSDGYLRPKLERTNNNTNTLQIAGIKVEKGSVATDWCPNPTEILIQSDYARIQATIGALGGKLADRPNPTETSLEYAKQALTDEKNAAQNNDFTSFDKKWAYSGTDLGFNYSPTSTTFKVWSPTATSVKLISYGKTTNPTATSVSSTSMTRGTSATPDNHATNTIGVWSLTIPGDQNGMVYAYELTFANGTVSDYAGSSYGQLYTNTVINTTNDPYSIATTQGGNRSVVVSPASVTSNLVLAQGNSATWRVAYPTQAIVDELHIRDFTISSTSGVSDKNRGKFLGVIQSGTTDPNTGTPTGLDYLKNEGFNYVQIMPSSQYSSVDESGNRTTDKPNNYNWGYDPQNEMVPEGEYASDSVNPVTRILEMKSMVQGLHENGIGIIMDMVFNHVSWQQESAFEKSEPGYYFRRYSQSGCGNDTASDHEMFGKFIIDAVTYWAKNYDIDGFRFDLMALLDSNTMNKLRAALNTIDPHIIMYGEGWQDSNENNIPETSLNNAKKVPGIGFFNPSERDAIVNNGGSAGGFVSGNTANTTMLASALLGSGGWNGSNTLQGFLTPSQSVNYIECHDSYTVNDALWSANPNDSVPTHHARVVFANAINILANGITFMEAGQEFGRTKLVNPSNLTQLSPEQTQAYQSGSMAKPAWYSASWDTAKNSYNGLFAVDSKGNYYGNYWSGSNLGTPIVAGDVVNGINWDNVKDNQNDVNLISKLINFKKSNPQFWPDSYGYLAWTPTGTGAENVTNASNGVITEELTSGSTKYLVVLNASGNSVTVGKGGQFYGTTDLTGKAMIVTNQGSLSSNQVSSSSVTITDLIFAVIKLS